MNPSPSSYTVTATDSEQATATTTVAFTITGTNDAPTVSADQATSVSELVDASAQNLSDSGTVFFDDIDATDTVSISFAPNNDVTWVNPDGETIDPATAAALVAGFNTGVIDADAPGTTPWNYSVLGADLDFLAEGESITFSYTVTATDSEQATATTTVAFTITGTNDAPTVSADQATTVSELVDASAQNLSDSGTVFFDDIDTTDTVSISFAPNNDITWVNPDGETIDPATAAALVR